MPTETDQNWIEDIVAPDGGDSIHTPTWEENLVVPDGGDVVYEPEILIPATD